MLFRSTNDFSNWHVLKIDQVREIVSQNKQKIKISALEDYAETIVVEVEKTFNNAMGQESLTRFDQPKSKSKSKNRNKNKGKVAIEGQSANLNPNQQKPNPNQNPNQKKPNPNQQKTNPNQQNNTNENAAPVEKKKPIIIKKNENPT